MKTDFAAPWHSSGMTYLRITICCILEVAYELLLHVNFEKLEVLSRAARQMSSNQWHSNLGLAVALLFVTLFGTSALLLHNIEMLGRSPSSGTK